MSELNRDAFSPTCGCFDRRFWAWKLIDFPEATFQRNTHALSWFLQQPENDPLRDQLVEAVRSGLIYAVHLQHRDGSFDQAFPYERSFGATGFLLNDLVIPYQIIKKNLNLADQDAIEKMLYLAGIFLTRNHEGHGLISNHLAGAALGLIRASELFGSPIYKRKAEQLIDLIIKRQSPEGWFEEYGGADPGYQTLCMYYLAQIDQLIESDSLKASIRRSLEFLQYFVHPDGTFGGEYGSRRTEIYYPGGIALLTSQNPIAARMHQIMSRSISEGNTVTLADMDMGNTAPLLMNMILMLNTEATPESNHHLPYELDQMEKVFPGAGIAIRSNHNHWTIFGASNGGTIRIYEKSHNRLIYEDCGLRGVTTDGKKVTSQVTDLNNALVVDREKIACESGVYYLPSSQPTPFKFLILRLANLTVMRIPLFNEWLKKVMVGALITHKKTAPISLIRTLAFHPDAIELIDRVKRTGDIRLESLCRGGKFISIHMASARYFSPARKNPDSVSFLDVQEINTHGELTSTKKISLAGLKGKLPK